MLRVWLADGSRLIFRQPSTCFCAGVVVDTLEVPFSRLSAALIDRSLSMAHDPAVINAVVVELMQKDVWVQYEGVRPNELAKENGYTSVTSKNCTLLHPTRFLVAGFSYDDDILTFPSLSTTTLPDLARTPPISRSASPYGRRKTGFQDEMWRELGDVSPQLDFAAWGYSVLAITWLLFALGLVSVLGVWPLGHERVSSYSDYERKTGQPIPVYYPSLVVLSGVIAWIWCIVSWVGMKFFRHAKVD